MAEKKSDREFGDLRSLAEQVLRDKHPDADGDLDNLPPGESRRLLHELRVHQIEMEMQNEELHRARLELEASRAEYFALYDLAPAGYLILDRHGLIRKANLSAARLLGLERGALIGKPLARFIAGEDQDSYYLLCKELLTTGGGKAFEVGIVQAGGARFWVRLEMAAAGGGEGELPGWRAVIIDITGRKQAEEALREREEQLAAAIEELRADDRRKDEFMGILSHEIRNPLASIMLNLSLLEKVDPDGEQSVKAREIMKRQATQLSRLVDDLLDVTRIKHGKIELQKEQVQLHELARRTVEDYRAAFQEKGVVLAFQPAPTGLYVEADPSRLAQVVGNLLQNALKFTEPGGLTRLSIVKDDLQQSAITRVEDNGIGMSPEMLKNIFIPFMQADTSLDRNGSSGLGLGLVLVKGLTELHGGEVHACSDGPGKGSVFTVYLPLSAGPVLARTDETAATVPCRTLRVLVIEDIKDIADSLMLLLAEEGHEVAVAYDGPGGIARAKEFHPEVLLCDIGLPGMDGYQVARAFGADEDLKNIYLVSLAGYTRPEDIKKAKEAGFDHQLAKPVKLEKIRKVFDYYTTSI